jgi:hypothetical protein
MRNWYDATFGVDMGADAGLHFTRSFAMRTRRGMLGTADTVAIEVVLSKASVRWRIGVTQREEPQVLGAFQQAFPAAKLVPTERITNLTAAWELRTSTNRRPMAGGAPAQVVAGLLGSLQDLHDNEEVILCWLIGPWLPRPAVNSPKRTSRQPSWFDLAQLTLDAEEVRAVRKKQEEPLLGAACRIGVRASSPGRAEQLRQRVVGALALTRASGVGLQRRIIPRECAIRRLAQLQQPSVSWPCVVSASELVSLLCLPIGNPNVPNVVYGGGRVLPPVRGTYNRPDLRITGQSIYPGREHRVGMTAEAMSMHSVLVGPTGTGKSTVLSSLALQAAEANNSVIILDPSVKADLVREVAEHLPKRRLEETIVLSARSSSPVGFNPLIGEPSLVADTILHVFSDLFASSWGPRTADVLLNGVLTLASAGGYSLAELMPLMQNEPFRRSVLARFGRDDHLGVGPFWSRYEALSEGERLQVVGPVQNKLQSFTSRPAVRAILGQHPGFDLSEIFFKRRILLVSLAPGEIGSVGAELLGSLLVGALWAAAQRRSRLTPERRFPVLICLDEFQTLLRLGDVENALAQARGLGVGFVLAHQTRSQLTPTLRSAVDGNARSKVVFQTGAEDGAALAKLLGGGLTATDLMALDRYETYQSLVVDGRVSPPMSVRTLPLGNALNDYDEVRSNSESKYGRKRSEVDAELLRRRQVGSTDGVIGSRKRGGRP